MKLVGNRNQCPGCSQYFNSNSAFEKHRVGEFSVNRRCLSPDEMIKKGMALNSAGFWVGDPMPEDAKLRRANHAKKIDTGVS